MIKAIIFDVDGVLLDNTKVYIKAYKEIGRRLGLKIPSDSEIRKTFGLTWDEVLTNLFGNADEKLKNTYVEIIRGLEHEIKISEGLEYVLEELKIKKAITSSKSRQMLEKYLGAFTKFFEVIITREDTEKHKPNPEPLILTCKKLGIKTGEAIYVGDAVLDYQTAKNAGTGFIGFLSGAASKEDFESVNVKFITSLKELLKVI